MKIVLVRTKQGTRYNEIIKEYLISRGIECSVVRLGELREIMAKKELAPRRTIIHVRTGGPQTSRFMKKLEDDGFLVINTAQTLERTNNKYLANVIAAKNGLPIARTHKVAKNNLSEIKELIKKYQTAVLKPVRSQGQGKYCFRVSAAENEASLKDKLAQIPGQKAQLQEFIDYQKLIRVIVIGFRVLPGATTFDEPGQEWKCSVCLNPDIKKHEVVSEGLVKLAEKTARVFNSQIGFIDFFEDRKGNFILNEINTACNLRFHEKITGVPIHRFIGDYLIAQGKKLLTFNS